MRYRFALVTTAIFVLLAILCLYFWWNGRCPDGYISIAANSDLQTGQFCVARFEMKNDHDLPVSRAAGKPWNQVTRNQAIHFCASLGERYALITNEQWQAVAREIESVAVNWSSNTAGEGTLNIGNYSTEMGGANENDPCATEEFPPRFSHCTDQASPDFLRKRTHRLSNGEEIWDFGGNVFEWVKTDVSAVVPGDFRGPPCALTDVRKKNFGPKGSYVRCDESNSDGFGCIEGEFGTVIFRGGQAGMENSAWHVCPGIFYANTNSFWDANKAGPGFRCVFDNAK